MYITVLINDFFIVSVEPGTRPRHVENMLPSVDLPAVMALEKVKINILSFW